MVSATPWGSSPKPFSKSALTGSEVAATDRSAVFEHRLRDPLVIAKPLREGKAGAGRRQGLKAETLEKPGRPDVPRIGHHEGAGPLVQLAECLCFFEFASAWAGTLVEEV